MPLIYQRDDHRFCIMSRLKRVKVIDKLMHNCEKRTSPGVNHSSNTLTKAENQSTNEIAAVACVSPKARDAASF